MLPAENSSPAPAGQQSGSRLTNNYRSAGIFGSRLWNSKIRADTQMLPGNTVMKTVRSDLVSNGFLEPISKPSGGGFYAAGRMGFIVSPVSSTGRDAQPDGRDAQPNGRDAQPSGVAQAVQPASFGISVNETAANKLP